MKSSAACTPVLPRGNTLFFFWYLYSSSPGNINEAQIELRKTFPRGNFLCSAAVHVQKRLNPSMNAVNVPHVDLVALLPSLIDKPCSQNQFSLIGWEWKPFGSICTELCCYYIKGQRTVNYTALTQFYRVKLKPSCYTCFIYPFSHFSSLKSLPLMS